MGIVKHEELLNLENRIKAIEQRFGNMTYDMRGVVQSELKDRMVVHQQSESQFGLYTALCVETIDIWKQNRIRFFCPTYHNPKRPIKELPWAYPVSSMGGFDDCGLSWVPPAGSTVCILFEGGQRSSPFYIGTTWHRDRGPTGQHNWGYNIDEYYKIWEGHRKGYLVGANDESQVFPPWNTESYNGFDLSSIVDFASNPEAQRRITYPNIYGFKTPEKHMIKMVDGDPKCNRRWKRFEIMSSCGNWIMLKDDHLHYAGQWSHPQCGVEDADVSCVEGQTEGSAAEDITRFQGLSASNPLLDANTNDTTPKEGRKKEDDVGCNGKIIGGHPSTGHPKTTHYQSQKGANPYFKNQNECRPYMGPGTPQNNKCDLPQTGVQIMSISGHTLVFDDSVEEPSGAPEWERSMKDFDFGCNDHYVGRCVGCNEKITLADGTREIAGNLCGTNFQLPDIDNNGNLRIVNAFAEVNCIENVYKITLDNGHEIIRNYEHPLWTMNRTKIQKTQSLKQRKGTVKGWTKVQDISVGDYIAIANEMKIFGNSKISENDAKILGYLIGDGGFTGVNVKFSQQQNKQLEEMKVLADHYNCNLKYIGKYDYHLATKDKKNKIIELLKTHNLMGCHSKYKRVPDEIFKSSEKIVAIFLNRLFSTDGWASASKNGVGQIGFCSISKQLICDIQHLCMRFGVHGKIRHKKIKPSKLVKKASEVWCYEIFRSEDIIAFASNIGIYGKEQAIEFLLEMISSRKHQRKWMKDQLPDSLRWCKIKKIEILDPQLTVAIQVPNTHTFLTDVWEHNTYWKSATGHSIELSDVESPSGDMGAKLRGEDNYIRLLTANGNIIELNDHTVAQKDCPGCPPNVGGSKRGVFIGSTSGHTFEMNDQTVEQCSPCRKENGYSPKRKAKQAFVKIRTGYGLEFLMKDEASQEETMQQHIQLFCPQIENKRRGPHIHRYQESKKGPGLVFLRVGGNYVVMTYDNKVEVVGDVKKNPADKTEIISRKKLVYTKDAYINVTEKTHTFIAKQKIMLLAGEDCQPKDGGTCGPCTGPVLVYVNGMIRLSDRLIGSSSSQAPAASIFMLSPLIKSPPSQNACAGKK